MKKETPEINMIKLIASDIDGTLVTESTNNINPELLEVILKLKKKGIHFTAASGRQAASIEHLFEPIRDKIFYIAENGAYVGCYGRMLFSTPMDWGLIKNLIEDSRKVKDCNILVCSPHMAYTENKDNDFIDWLKESYHTNATKVEDLLEIKEEIIKISLNRKENIHELLEYPMENYRNKLKYSLSGDTWLDVMNLEVNKGNAIKLLQESLEITPEETMAFGDQLNDIEMMKQAYYSYAVGNAREETKEAARYITDTNENDGVLKVLKTLL